MKRMPVSYVCLGQESFESTHILNPNAFPQGMQNNVWACADKVALMHYSLQFIEREIKSDLIKFIKELHHGKAWVDFPLDPQGADAAIYHSISFQVGLQAFIISTKSMLDIYAQIVSKLIQPQSSLFGFNKGTFRGAKIVGGVFLNWIECNSPATYLNKNQLLGLLINHINDWISKVVTYRDQIIHKGNINGLIEMVVPLRKKPQEIREDEIIIPAIKDEGDVLAYCNCTLQNVYRMLKETLPLLPNVELNLIRL